MNMDSFAYAAGTLICLLCALLLLRAYFRVRKQLLLWSGLCFAGLTISNGLIFVDLVMLPDVDLWLLRLGTAAVSMLLLLYGLIFRSDR